MKTLYNGELRYNCRHNLDKYFIQFFYLIYMRRCLAIVHNISFAISAVYSILLVFEAVQLRFGDLHLITYMINGMSWKKFTLSRWSSTGAVYIFA